jgi:hypothetical protein
MNNPRIKHAAILIIVFILCASVAGTVSAQDYIPTPPPGTIILPPPPGGGEVDTPTGTIDLPPNPPYNLVYTPLGSVSCPPPVGCLVFNPFDLSAYDGVDLVSPAYFDPPLEICMNYTDTEVEALGGVENLTIAYWHPEQNQWVPLRNIRMDTATQQICGDLDALLESECGIALTCALSPGGVPVTGSGLGSHFSLSPMWLTIAVAIILTFYLWTRRRQIVE